MSYRKERQFLFDEAKFSAETGQNFEDYSELDLKKLWNELLGNGTHGLCFSIYEDGQGPGDVISDTQVRRRMEIIKPYTKWVRSFSCIEGNEHIPKVAKDLGLKTMVGAWLSGDEELNKKEIEALIQLGKDGLVDIAAVGNEVMYRNEMSEEQLLTYIGQVKKALPNISVGYVDAYYEFSHRPNITDACDVILANCYPYWEGCHIDYSLLHMKQMYHQALSAGNGKQVIITETGWPSQGGSLKASEAGMENAMKYFINAQQWSKDDNIEMFYFSSFDESWKVGAEGDVGAYWGLWDKNEKLKYQ